MKEMTSIATEKNSTIVFPLPLSMMKVNQKLFHFLARNGPSMAPQMAPQMMKDLSGVPAAECRDPAEEKGYQQTCMNQDQTIKIKDKINTKEL